MGRICIITICNGSNFGNRLQNYALQEAVRLNTCNNVVTVKNLAGEVGSSIFLFDVIYKALQKDILSRVILRFVKHPKIRKKIKFIQFNKQYILWSKEVVNGDSIPDNFVDAYDYFITGSDQVWNLEIPFISSLEFLCFAPTSKKISYAASFGMNEFSSEKEKIIENRLKDFDNISVRESSALRILKKIGKCDVKVLVDPTMLLSAIQWEQIESEPEFRVDWERYILVYILEEDKSDVMDRVERMSFENDWKVIDIYDPKQYQYYGIGPEEFVYLIHHAAYVFTNSFHATVFSILFHKRFSVYNRERLNSRISTLLQILNIEKAVSKDMMKPVEWEQVEKIIEEQKQMGLNYLKECTSIVN